MDKLIFAILALAMAFIIFKNFSMVKRVKHNNQYIDCYKAMLNEDEGAYEMICSAIENEPSEEFRNKTRIFKLYCELDNTETLNTCINDINLKEIFYKNSKLDKQMVGLNSDSFLWIMLTMVKARNSSRFDIIDELVRKVSELSELDGYLEYHLVKALSSSLKEEEGLGLSFFKDLLEGNTYRYQHDKQLIGLYKRIAACMLDVNSELFDEYHMEDLKDFAETLVGKVFMKHVGNYDKHHIEETVVEEEDNKEENKEEE